MIHESYLFGLQLPENSQGIWLVTMLAWIFCEFALKKKEKFPISGNFAGSLERSLIFSSF